MYKLLRKSLVQSKYLMNMCSYCHVPHTTHIFPLNPVINNILLVSTEEETVQRLCNWPWIKQPVRAVAKVLSHVFLPHCTTLVFQNQNPREAKVY